MVFLASGCLVADPPDYEEPTKTPPVLHLLDANPPVTELVSVSGGETRSFSVPVQSEDLGDRLAVLLYLDYSIVGAERFLDIGFLPASSFDDQRNAEILWTVRESPGCHQLTMLVTHQSNLDERRALRSREDTGIATWWVAIDDLTATLESCPTTSGGTVQ